MPDYTRINFIQGTSPPINAANLNHMDAQLAAAPYSVFFLTTPYQFAANDSISGSATKTYTIVGNGTPSVPSGAKAALVSCFYVGSVTGTYLQMVAHGQTVANVSNWPLMGQAQVNSGQVAATAIVPLDATGKLDAIASQNITSLYASVYGYVY
jgi:hypothetical protein